jgi:hypothetical protein
MRSSAGPQNATPKRQVKRDGAKLMLAGMAAWIESASPFPWVGVKRVAVAPSDRPDVNIAVIDVPAIGPFGGIGGG